jgi:VanZ family protein
MVGRAPNVMNVVFALPGAAIGAFVVPRIVGAARFKPVRDWAVLALALSFLTYAELTPFTFTLSPIVVREQIASIEWMPFLSYFYVDPRQALLDVWNKILLGGFLGFALTRLSGARWAGTVGGLAAGLLLEALQLLTFVRRASVTDVLMLTIAAWIGGWLERRYRVERQAAHPLAEDYEFNALRGRL